jgi:hypothetical protein
MRQIRELVTKTSMNLHKSFTHLNVVLFWDSSNSWPQSPYIQRAKREYVHYWYTHFDTRIPELILKIILVVFLA